MVRTTVYFFVAVVVLGTIATPGLGAVALLLAPLLGLGLLWRIALTVFTHGRPVDAVVHTRQSHLLGPGGPDDSFAVSARDGFVRGANVPRRGFAETPAARRRGASSIHGGAG